MIKNIILFCTLIQFYTFSQTFDFIVNDTIYDNQTNNYEFEISGLPTEINTSSFGFESVCVKIFHTYTADLQISVIAPDGTTVLLASGIGGDSDSLNNTCFSMDATQNITTATFPFSGNFTPLGQLGLFNNNQNPNGTWVIRIDDTWEQDAGYFLDVSFTFGTNPANVFTITDSSLPILLLNTFGTEIPNEPKLDCAVKIIYNGEGNRNYVDDIIAHFQGHCGVEIRGASSSGMPKKSYDLEIRDSFGNDLDTSILGLPAESDWVLSAQYTDKTLLRNMLSMHLIQSTGRYAPRFKPVELFINNEYKGVYIFMEKVKRGNDRIDISKLDSTEISGDNLTGGYIIKLDKDSGNSNPGWESPFAPIPSGSPIVLDYNYPDGNQIVPEQMEYIRNYITEFESLLASENFMNPISGYRKLVDYSSCIDALLISELTKSIDAYRKSFFLFKDKDSKGGKLTMAPIWDYDLTYGNADFCEGQNPEGWQYNFNYVCGGDYWVNPFWFPRMMEDSMYRKDLACRWNDLRQTSFHLDSIYLWIDQMVAKLDESQNWNYQIWPTMGAYVWPNSFVGANYQEEINFLKSWIQQRINWLDDNIIMDEDYCIHLTIAEKYLPDFKIYPNPSQDFVYLESKNGTHLKSIEILNTNGLLMQDLKFEFNLSSEQIKIDLSNYNSGLYFIKIKAENEILTLKIIKE